MTDLRPNQIPATGSDILGAATGNKRQLYPGQRVETIISDLFHDDFYLRLIRFVAQRFGIDAERVEIKVMGRPYETFQVSGGSVFVFFYIQGVDREFVSTVQSRLLHYHLHLHLSQSSGVQVILAASGKPHGPHLHCWATFTCTPHGCSTTHSIPRP